MYPSLPWAIMIKGLRRSPNSMNNRIKFLVVVSSTCLVLLLLIGSVLGKSASPDDAYKHIAVYTEVLQRIKSEYVEEPDMKSVTLGALNGLLESIDPFASYMNAEQYRDYLKEKDRKKADVGLILSKTFGYLGVVGVIPNSPAAKAGLGTLRHDRERQGHWHPRYAAGIRRYADAGRVGLDGGALGGAVARHGATGDEAGPRHDHVIRRWHSACCRTRSAI